MKVNLYTDGIVTGNGFGGYAYILRYTNGNGEERAISSAEGDVAGTHNRAKMLAIIHGLSLINQPHDVTVYTDLEYLRNGINGRVNEWIKSGWKCGKKMNQDVQNIDLWLRLLVAMRPHNVTAKRAGKDAPDAKKCKSMAFEAAKRIERLAVQLGVGSNNGT